ncbi:hypothetical protein N665_0035s0033 [Sinapis alba]|nr:hypothetical protein N665_0035s0033 [Sinapis alba]
MALGVDDHNVNVITCLWYQAIVYGVWKERNSKIHTSSSRSPKTLIEENKSTEKLHLDPLSRKRISCSNAFLVFV